MEDTYLTLSTTSEGLYKEKGSKFLAFAIPVSSVSEIKSILEEKRKEFYDARHVCYAYIIGTERQESRSNDDGEPSGTAGKPILGSLLSKQLTNVLIVVAGMEGALASVVGGLVNKPVVAVPTSIGYGANFGGLSALLGMLNSCSAGVAVVNIDNGFGAGRLASIINHMR